MPTYKFNHQPHLVGQPETVCLNCHTRKDDNQDTPQSENVVEESPPDSHKNWLFSPVTKQPCATCHQEEKAGENCLLCHNYHFEEAPWAKALSTTVRKP